MKTHSRSGLLGMLEAVMKALFYLPMVLWRWAHCVVVSLLLFYWLLLVKLYFSVPGKSLVE